MTEHLAPFADIVVSSRSRNSGSASHGAQFAALEQVLSQPIIIPSIPSQFFQDFFSENTQIINPKALFIDVCSVKEKPLTVLETLLPPTCGIIGTHPLFGPVSVAKNRGIDGLRCVVCPVRVDDEVLGRFREFLSNDLKLKVLERTPTQHDQEMAYVQGLSHYIGRVMDGMKIPESELSTLAYDDLLDMKNTQGADSWDLFTSIMKENPYAEAVSEQFKTACQDLDDRLAG